MMDSFKRLLNAICDEEEQMRAERLLDEIYVNLLMNHLRRKQQKDRLLLLIDDALDQKNQHAFLEYTTILQKLDS